MLKNGADFTGFIEDTSPFVALELLHSVEAMKEGELLVNTV
jgi:hypothetical protein